MPREGAQTRSQGVCGRGRRWGQGRAHAWRSCAVWRVGSVDPSNTLTLPRPAATSQAVPVGIDKKTANAARKLAALAPTERSGAGQDTQPRRVLNPYENLSTAPSGGSETG